MASARNIWNSRAAYGTADDSQEAGCAGGARCELCSLLCFFVEQSAIFPSQSADADVLQQPFVTGNDGAAVDEQRRDSQWIYSSESSEGEKPTSCFGHFDRLDLEYTPRPVTRARVIVYHDGPIADWSSRPPGLSTAVANQDFAAMTTEDGGLDGFARGSSRTKAVSGPDMMQGGLMSGGLGSRQSPSTDAQRPDSRQSWLGSAQAACDREVPSPAQLDGATSLLMEDADAACKEELRPDSLGHLLAIQRSKSATAGRLTVTEDPYFAGRLAYTALIMLRDGLMVEARRLAQWSVNLVGNEEWRKMVENHGSAPKHEDDDSFWMAWMLGEVDVNLRKVDVRKADELRHLVSQWTRLGILPQVGVLPPSANRKYLIVQGSTGAS